MTVARCNPAKAGSKAFSLVELLCTIGIILILAGLLLGSVFRAYSKARRLQVEMEGDTVLGASLDRLRKFNATHPTYERLTQKDLEDAGVLDSKTLSLMKRGYIVYLPFSSTDNETNDVFLATFSKDAGVEHITKKMATETPPEQ